MKEILSFLGKVLAVILAAFLLVLGAIQVLKEKAGEGNAVLDSLAEIHKNDWVDLGLPSGLLWGKTNVGGTSAGETNYFYAWGDTACRESDFRWLTYRFTEGDRVPETPSRYASQSTDYGKLLKYCTNAEYGKDGLADNLTSLQPEDDAATLSWGTGARIPTSEEWKELKENTTQQWTTVDGIAGMLFKGRNGNSIFLPAAGYGQDGWLESFGTYGSYWSSTLGDKDMELSNSNHEVYAIVNASYTAKCFDFNSNNHFWFTTSFRYNGLSIRAVRSKD